MRRAPDPGAEALLFAHRENWKRIYIDLPGMGKSESPDWLRTHDQILGVLTEFILNIISDERFCVVGLSYGGLLAQGLIHRFAPQMDGVMFLVPSMASIDESSCREMLRCMKSSLTSADSTMK